MTYSIHILVSGQDDDNEKEEQKIREAEEAGRAGVDPRSDDELRESIREMWEEDRQREQEQR